MILAATACVPETDDRLSLVDAARVIAVQSTPAEVEPGKPFTLDALRVDSHGDAPSIALRWAICTDRKPLTELGPANTKCVNPSDPGLIELGNGPSASGVMPLDACRLFGPVAPEPQPGQPSGRPVDADATGGFFVPIQLLDRDGGGAPTLGFVRITCGLASVTPEQSADYGARYRANVNPVIEKLSLVRGATEITIPPASSADDVGTADDTGALPPTLTPGERVTLRSGWTSACSDTATCTGAEHYVWFDPVARQIAPRRESVRVSWFSTAGALDEDTTGRTEDDLATTSDNGFVAPREPGEFSLWVVVRDDRGGSSFTRHRLFVRR